MWICKRFLYTYSIFYLSHQLSFESEINSFFPWNQRTLYTFELFIDYRFQQDAQVSFVVKAVSALTAAFRLVQLDHCSQSVLASCLRQVHSDLHEDILTNLRKLSFTSMGTSPTEVKGTQHHFTRNGRLVANKQLVFQINQAVGMESVSTTYTYMYFY